MSLLQKQNDRLKSVDYSLKPPFPKELFLELNNICNHHCFFCSNSKMRRDKEFLDDGLAKKIMLDAFRLGATDISFYATGEPLISPNLPEYIKLAKDIGYKYIFLTTNGSLGGDEKIKSIIDAGLDSIKFSINAGTKESYARVHGRDDFDKVLENLKKWFEYKNSSGSKMRIFCSFVPTPETSGEVSTLSEKIRAYLDEDINARSCSNQGGNMIENNEIVAINPANILGTLRENQFTKICPDPFNRVVVSSEGYLTACVVDYQNALTVADLREMNIGDAWHNQIFEFLRKKHLDGELANTICDNCINNRSNNFEPLIKEHFRPFMDEYKGASADDK